MPERNPNSSTASELVRAVSSAPHSSARATIKRLLLATLLCLALAALTTWAALLGPWLGISLRTQPETNSVLMVDARGPAAHIPALRPGTATAGVGLMLVGIASSTNRISLQPTDLIEEPDFFDHYFEMRNFFARQSQLREILNSDQITLTTQQGDQVREYSVRPALRPLSTLPATYWFQLGAGAFGFLLAYWVWLLRPKDLAVRAFAAMGAMIVVFTYSSAIYSSRELAISGTWFRALSSINHAGANLFGSALVVLFASFPEPIRKSRIAEAHARSGFPQLYVGLVPALFGLWWLTDALHLAPNQDWGSRIPILLETLIALVLCVVQRVRLRRDPRARAVLRTFGVSVLLGASLFVVSTIGISMFGALPQIPQAYSFGFFLIMHLGLALGLRRHRLFELSRAAFSVFVWVVGAISLVALDAGLAVALEGRRGLATTTAMLLCGLIYFPLRSWVWRRVVRNSALAPSEAFARTLEVTFADPGQRQAKWEHVLRDAFDALEVTTALGERGAEPQNQANSSSDFIMELPPHAHARILQDGLVLAVPGAYGLAATYVHHPFKGREVFGETHAQLADALAGALQRSEEARAAYERGVRVERERIARDLHDDVGARLLTGVYQQEVPALHATLREAIGEMRSIVRELSGKATLLANVLGDARDEAQARLELANCTLEWRESIAKDTRAIGNDDHVPELFARGIRSAVRELTSNIVKHAHASQVTAELRIERQQVTLVLRDNGTGFSARTDAADEVANGNGLRNLQKRLRQLGGSASWTSSANGTESTLVLPLSLWLHTAPLTSIENHE